jgi:hypothetical protein
MKASLQIDDDIYDAVEQLASSENRSVDEVLSELLRKGLEAERGECQVPMFSVTEGSPTITREMVKAALADP